MFVFRDAVTFCVRDNRCLCLGTQSLCVEGHNGRLCLGTQSVFVLGTIGVCVWAPVTVLRDTTGVCV